MKREWIISLTLLILTTLFFFYPVFKGNIPFPGDLLISEYTPYNSYSYHGYAPGAYPNKGQDFDVLRLIYPAKFFSISSLKNGEIPLWNPYIFSGNPHLASLQSGTFYSLNFLFFIMPFAVAWAVFIISQPILAGFFTFLFLRELKISKYASFFGAVVFAFSSFLVVWIEYGNLVHTILWLPLILYLILQIIQRPNVYKHLLFIFALTSTIFAGYIQFAIYIYIFSFIFLLICLTGHTGKIRILVKFLFLYFVSILLSSIQFLPTTELFLNSTRASYSTSEFLNLLIPSYHFITFLIPDYFGNPATRNYWLTGTYIERVIYIGVIPAFFAIYSLMSKGNKMIWFFAVASLFTLILVFDTFISHTFYSIFIPPILSTAVPSRMLFIFCFSMSTLAAFGIEKFFAKSEKKKFFILLFSFIAIFASIWAFTYFGFLKPEALTIAKRNIMLPTFIFLIFSFFAILYTFKKGLKRPVLILLILLTIFDLFYFFKKITPFAPIDTLYPSTAVIQELKQIEGEDRVWGYESGDIATNLQIMEKIYGAEGYDALHIKRYGEFIIKSESRLKTPPRSEAEISNGYGVDEFRQNSIKQRILNILGVKFVMNKSNYGEKPDTSLFQDHIYSLLWSDKAFQIYENRESTPRAYLAQNIFVGNDDKKVLELLFDEKFNPKTDVVLEEKVLVSNSKASGSAKIISYTSNKARIDANSKDNSLLVLSDSYYPGWKATIDGKETKIYRANYAFRAVVVPKGEHKIEFSYQPKIFKYGFIISALTLLGMVLYWVYTVKKK